MKRITVEIKDDEKFIGYYTINKNGLNEYHPCKEVSASKADEPQESESKRYMELAKSYVQGLREGLAESEERDEI